MEKVTFLELQLQQQTVGYLAGFSNGKNVLVFADSYRHNPKRLPLGLITHPAFPAANKLLAQDWVKQQRLHPLLSNLLPEGALRELLSQNLKTHPDNEFRLLQALGHDLPGALTVQLLAPEAIPDFVLAKLGQHNDFNQIELPEPQAIDKFSLAGVQMKFSMKALDGRFNLSGKSTSGDPMLGDWIIKTPSTRHAFVPLNEYSAMRLAQMVGIDIPEIQLVALNKLDNLPELNLPQEQYAFAIKRFDRQSKQVADQQITTRIHMEDFAQVFAKYAHEKYSGSNSEQIGKVIAQFSSQGEKDVIQLAKRLLINILLANGDAHLKNWSLLYPDHYQPQLSPAYDILTTAVYMKDEYQLSLNLGKNKDWYQANFEHFQLWAQAVGIDWQRLKPELQQTMTMARELWPKALAKLPMIESHQSYLVTHWQKLHADFKISC